MVLHMRMQKPVRLSKEMTEDSFYLYPLLVCEITIPGTHQENSPAISGGFLQYSLSCAVYIGLDFHYPSHHTSNACNYRHLCHTHTKPPPSALPKK